MSPLALALAPVHQHYLLEARQIPDGGEFAAILKWVC
jgi:hypothetical protein